MIKKDDTREETELLLQKHEGSRPSWLVAKTHQLTWMAEHKIEVWKRLWNLN